MLPSDDARRAAIEHALATDPTLRASVAAALDVLAQTAQGLAAPPLPPEPPPSSSPPSGPRGGRRKRTDEPIRENYSSDHSFQNAHYKWRRANGIKGGSRASSVTRAITSGDGAVTSGDVLRSPEVTDTPVTHHPNDGDPITSGDGAVTRTPSPESPRVTPRARASEGLSLCISPENNEKPVVVVSGFQSASAREASPEVTSRSGDRHPSPVTRHPSPDDGNQSVTPAPGARESGDYDDYSSLNLLSPEAERMRVVLCRESDGKVAGVLLGNRARAFNEVVAALAAQGFREADFERFARAVKSGAAKKWWDKGFALPALCNPGDDKRTPCYGLTRGLEEARKLGARLDAPAGTKAPAPGPRPLTLAQMRDAIGAMPWMKAGGT